MARSKTIITNFDFLKIEHTILLTIDVITDYNE